MSVGGNSAYRGLTDLPALVAAAVERAERAGFDHSCAPQQGRLLAVLAAGWRGGRVGETGTGHGVGLAWMLSAAGDQTSFVSIERDVARARDAAAFFADRPNVRVRQGDWSQLVEDGPFDLLVLDGGGKGKEPGDDPPLDPTAGWLAPGGTVVLDDFVPAGAPGAEAHDRARRHWLDHPALHAAELRLSPTLATIVGVRVR